MQVDSKKAKGSTAQIMINYESEAMPISEQQRQEFMRQVKQVPPGQSKAWLD